MRVSRHFSQSVWRWLIGALLTLALGGYGASSVGQITTQPTATATAPPPSGVKLW